MTRVSTSVAAAAAAGGIIFDETCCFAETNIGQTSRFGRDTERSHSG
jgi:hypothetical protein